MSAGNRVFRGMSVYVSICMCKYVRVLVYRNLRLLWFRVCLFYGVVYSFVSVYGCLLYIKHDVLCLCIYVCVYVCGWLVGCLFMYTSV